MKKVVLLNSGGLDSAIVAYKLKKDGFEPVSFYVDYVGLPNSEETAKSALETATRFCTGHYTLTKDFTEQMKLSGTPWTHIPGIIRASIADGLTQCSLLGVYELYTGAMGGALNNEVLDTSGYDRTRPVVVAPLNNLKSKEEVIAWAGITPEELAELSYTYTCREVPPCGVCDRCLLRARLGV